MRLDKWLWAARFYKTRGLAQEAIEGGRVRVDGERVKRSREVKLGDRLEISVGELKWEVTVRALSDKRGPAAQARLLYEELEESRVAREEKTALRKLMREPEAERHGRPEKKDRRRLERLRGW